MLPAEVDWKPRAPGGAKINGIEQSGLPSGVTLMAVDRPPVRE